MPQPRISIQPSFLQKLQPLPPHLKQETSISADGSVHTAPSVPATVVDTIGAGDSHCGAVLTGLTLGWTEEDTMRFANQVASEVVAQEGGAYIRH